MSAAPIPRADASLMLDVTEHGEAEQHLASSENFLRTVLETSLDGFWIVDQEGRLLDVNPAYCAMSGYGRVELLGMRIPQLEAVETSEETAANIQRIREAGGGRFERRHRRKDGSILHVDISVTLVGGPNGAMVCFLRDVTERKAMEQALRASEGWHRQAVDTLPVLVWTSRPDGYLEFANEQWCDFSGLTLAQITGSGFMAVLHPEDLERTLAAFEGAGGAGEYQVEQRLRRHDGEYRWFLARGHLLRDGAGNPLRWFGVNLEIHDRKEAEEALRKSQAKLAVASRLAAMGTLVSGVAHEINNPLAGTLSAQALALDDVRSIHDFLEGQTPFDREAACRILRGAVEALEDAQLGARRVSRIVKDMTAFGRPDPRRARMRLMEAVGEVMDWLPESLAGMATVHVEDRGAPDVLGSARQIEQVIVNLVTNAARAMPAGRIGRVVISCGPGSDGMAWLEVVDDGSGMAPRTLERAFDPFFTTRPVGEGRGTGLGLAICQAIATAHGGTLMARSEAGKGSVFRLELPAAPPA